MNSESMIDKLNQFIETGNIYKRLSAVILLFLIPFGRYIFLAWAGNRLVKYLKRGIGGKINEFNSDRVITRNGKVCTLTHARKGHKCVSCGLSIESGDYYYSCVQGGGGLGWSKYPDHVHQQCIDNYLKGGSHVPN